MIGTERRREVTSTGDTAVHLDLGHDHGPGIEMGTDVDIGGETTTTEKKFRNDILKADHGHGHEVTTDTTDTSVEETGLGTTMSETGVNTTTSGQDLVRDPREENERDLEAVTTSQRGRTSDGGADLPKQGSRSALSTHGIS